MLELLTGTGLAASAGLNAWIPLLAVGLIARYTELLTLPAAWEWLSNGWALGILAILLVTELVADKIPVVDSVQDVLYTVVRPASGGLAFGAGSSSETVTVSDPGAFFTGDQWQPMAVGAAIALVVHLLKALIRPVVNTMTLGIGAPVVSTAEDITSVGLSVVAILAPLFVIVFLFGLVAFFWWGIRRRRARRRARRQVVTPAG